MNRKLHTFPALSNFMLEICYYLFLDHPTYDIIKNNKLINKIKY